MSCIAEVVNDRISGVAPVGFQKNMALRLKPGMQSFKIIWISSGKYF